MQPRISLVTLGVTNLQRSVEFYESGLGLRRFEPISDDVAFFVLNGTWLGLYPWEKLAEDAEVDGTGTGFRGVTLAHNLHSRAAVDQLIDLAVQAGATLRKAPRDVFWGGYSGYFADPDGHLWEVAWNPHMWIGPADTENDETGS